MKYKLIMVIANIKHKAWWWNGKSNYEFETLDEVLNFMKEHIPLTDRDIDTIRESDEKQNDGRLACTSWYEVKKGEDKMTDYTSL